MKKSYIKILIIEIMMLIFMFVNSIIIKNTMSYYPMVVINVLFLVTIIILLGYEKDNFRYKKDVLLSLLIYIFIFLILYYVLSLPLGYLRNGYSIFSFQTIFKIILPTILIIISSELLRYCIVTKSKNFTLGIVIITIILIISDVYFNIVKIDNMDFESIIKLLCDDLFPSVFKNILLTYLTYKVGFKSPIIYRLLMEITFIILPIMPNYGEYLNSVINTIFPMFVFFKIKNNFNDNKCEKIKCSTYSISIILIVLMIIMIALSSKMFKFYTLAIASNSMKSSINKGDVVIVEKVDNIESLEIGDVLVFENDNKIVVHRIINIYDINGQYYFETQGDNNPYKDGFITNEDQVRGKAFTKVSYIGWPAVWLSEFLGGSS